MALRFSRSLILVPERGSSMPLQHHLVTTAANQEASLSHERGKVFLTCSSLCLQYPSPPLGGVSVPCPSSSRAVWGIRAHAHEQRWNSDAFLLHYLHNSKNTSLDMCWSFKFTVISLKAVPLMRTFKLVKHVILIL